MHATSGRNIAHLADDVERVRTSLGLSQNAFARKAGVEPWTLSKLLNGKCAAAPTLGKVLAFIARHESGVARRRIRKSE